MKIVSCLILASLPVILTAGERRESPVEKSAVRATLVVPHATVLPGVPFDMVVTLKNISDRPVTVGLLAKLVATLPDGSFFLSTEADWLLEPNDTSGEPVTSIELAPGEAVERVANWDRGSIPSWSHSSSFSGPGDYQVSLQLARGYRDASGDERKNYAGTIHTSSALLRRSVPAGEDEAVWAEMQRVAAGHWSDDGFATTKVGKALAKEIIQVHPTSAYFPYALLLSNPVKQERDIAGLLDASNRFPNSPAFPYLLKAAGDAALYEARTAEAVRHDHSAAQNFYDLAEVHYRAALRTDSAAIRETAERSLDHAKREREKLKTMRER